MLVVWCARPFLRTNGGTALRQQRERAADDAADDTAEGLTYAGEDDDADEVTIPLHALQRATQT